MLLVGRDTAISVGRDVATPVMGGAFGVALVVGTLALFIGYIRRKRREGQPWLFHFILWPAYIGVLAVLGLAALHSSENACGGPPECGLGQIPLYWLPASRVFLGASLWWVENFIIRPAKIPDFPLYSQGRGLVPRNAAVVWFLGALKSRFGTARKAEKVGCRECVPRSISRVHSKEGLRERVPPRSHSPKLLALLSVWFSGWNEGSPGCSEVRLSCLPCSGWR